VFWCSARNHIGQPPSAPDSLQKVNAVATPNPADIMMGPIHRRWSASRPAACKTLLTTGALASRKEFRNRDLSIKGDRGEEEAAAVPVLHFVHVHQAEVRLVDYRRPFMAMEPG
jgi:hypothetical protein